MPPATFPTMRRRFLTGAATLAVAAAVPAETVHAADDAPLPAPKYTLSVNLEMMFPRAMPFDERLLIAAKEGAKAYSFWAWRARTKTCPKCAASPTNTR